MSIDLDQMTGLTNEAGKFMGARGHDRPPGRLEVCSAGGLRRPYEESLGELSLQLAARFAGDPRATGTAPGDMRAPVPHRPVVALALTFCLGASIAAAACSLYFFQDLVHRYLFDPAAEPAISLSTASAPGLSSTAIDPVPSAPEAYLAPSAPEAYKDRSARLTTAAEPVPAEPAAAVPIPDVRELNADEVRELQTLLDVLGLRPGRPDGIPGPLTAGAVRRYQESKGQLKSGGITRDVLGQLRQEMVPPVSAADFASSRP
jgi:hypothetical protein